jgi:hypothetical protein
MKSGGTAMMRTRLAVLLAALGSLAETHAASVQQPRTEAFSKLPDWTGIWEAEAWAGRTVAGRPPDGMKGLFSRTRLTGHPPYNPEWEARYQAGLKDTAALAALAASHKSCSFGFPMMMEAPPFLEFIMTPEQTLIAFETQNVRHIYTGGRTHPPEDELWPTPSGHSIGRWEGDTLVAHTVARRSSDPLGFASPLTRVSGKATFTERIRMVGPDRLENVMVIEDPIAFSQPWKVTLSYVRVKSIDRLAGHDCTENDRNPVIDGKLTIAPPR